MGKDIFFLLDTQLPKHYFLKGLFFSYCFVSYPCHISNFYIISSNSFIWFIFLILLKYDMILITKPLKYVTMRYRAGRSILLRQQVTQQMVADFRQNQCPELRTGLTLDVEPQPHPLHDRYQAHCKMDGKHLKVKIRLLTYTPIG